MKKQIAAYILSLGVQPHYCGKKRIMYITDPFKEITLESIEACIYNKFGFDLAFTFKTNYL